MRLTLNGLLLDSVGVEKLKTLLVGSDSNSEALAEALIQHILELKAQYAVIEEPYVDQDYSADYVNFYASAFRDYPRHTKRIHFFAEDISGLLSKPLHEQQPGLEHVDYCGFLVLRPIAQGPIGRTVLKFPSFGAGLTVRPCARADFKAHIWPAAGFVDG